MRKVYELDDHFFTGEQTVQPVVLWGANGRPIRENFTKTASEASEFIRSVEPKPGHTIVLVLALGAYESYDLNRNGDGFNEFPYRAGLKATCGCCESKDAWIAQDEVLPAHYKSFEAHGKIYRHHQNKDPEKACGDVLKAFWNPQMHRVELLLGIRNDLAPDLVERIGDGEYPAVSMGCRIKYDVCTICGHKAPTRAKYCDHLKYNMRQVTPSGLRAGALNPSPKFFDISFVVKPADLTGYMMKKVAAGGAYALHSSAELGEMADAMDEKRAAIRKIADIDKVVRGIPVDAKQSPLSENDARLIEKYRDTSLPSVVRHMPEMDDDTLHTLSRYPLARVLSTLTSAGVILTTPEFMRLVVEAQQPGTRIPEESLDASVALQGHLLDLLAEHPSLLDQMLRTHLFDIRPENVEPEIAYKAEKYLEKRSTISDYLTRNLVPQGLRPAEPRWTDNLTVVDPSTGTRFRTTRGAARDASDQIAKAQLAKMVGGAALMGAGYKVVSAGLPAALRPLALGTTGLIGYKTLKPDYGPHYMTEEGIAIPTLTELSKAGSEMYSVGVPTLGAAALVTALGHDYDSRLRRGVPVHDPRSPWYRRLYDQVGAYSSEHPVLSFLSALTGYGLTRKSFGKFSEYLGDPTNDGIDKLAEKIGSLVVW